ncbi:MAG: hypothetical protein JWQ79_2772 [Mucilaginibacter sp.]|nr:hypothetical protein [Mucilaginibacter sp.]
MIAMKKLIPLVFLSLILFSCIKDKPMAAVTVPVKFTSTSYVNLQPFDTTGKPLNMETPDVISNGLMNFLHTTLPESVNLATTHPELLASTAIGDVKITQTSSLDVTFVAEGTGFTNAIAFYTYPTNSPPASAADIKTITYIFADAGFKTPLTVGDKVNIGTFSAGTSVGFVLMKNAWDLTKHILNNDAVHFCSNDVLNPEVDPKLKKHAVLLNYVPENKMLIGFEDIDRTDPKCDNDFNDAVIYVTVK